MYRHCGSVAQSVTVKNGLLYEVNSWGGNEKENLKLSTLSKGFLKTFYVITDTRRSYSKKIKET